MTAVVADRQRRTRFAAAVAAELRSNFWRLPLSVCQRDPVWYLTKAANPGSAPLIPTISREITREMLSLNRDNKATAHLFLTSEWAAPWCITERIPRGEGGLCRYHIKRCGRRHYVAIPYVPSLCGLGKQAIGALNCWAKSGAEWKSIRGALY